MSKLTIYEYSGCGTCRKASKYLNGKSIDYKGVPIRENPPSKAQLKKMLKYMEGDIKKLFNTSGKDYREMNIKDKLKTTSEDKLLDMLSKNGNLIKRPFVLGTNFGTVGFKEDLWKSLPLTK